MRKSIVAAAVLATTLAIGAPAQNAAAMPAAAPAPLGHYGSAATVERTVLICGPWTCYWRPSYWGFAPYPYWGWRRHYWWGWRGPGWGWRPGWRRW
jgi:hypothetical protein